MCQQSALFLSCSLDMGPILVHVDTAGGRCLMSRTQEPGWVNLLLTQRGHVGDMHTGRGDDSGEDISRRGEFVSIRMELQDRTALKMWTWPDVDGESGLTA